MTRVRAAIPGAVGIASMRRQVSRENSSKSSESTALRRRSSRARSASTSPLRGGPFDLYLQALTVDQTQPGRFAFSNAASGEFLP